MATKHDSFARKQPPGVRGDDTGHSAPGDKGSSWTPRLVRGDRDRLSNGGGEPDTLEPQYEQHPSGGVGHPFAESGDGSGECHYPSRLRGGEQLHDVLFSADAAAILLLIALVALLAFSLIRSSSSAPAQVSSGNPRTLVWVDATTGLYFCPGAKIYGKGTGKFMSQREAMLNAYRPALRAACE